MEKREGNQGDSFTSILDLEESPYKDKPQPAFYLDLNLDQIIERIRLDWGWNISSFYYYLPANGACEDYRREVFADIKRGNVYNILYDFTEKMKERREVFFKKEEIELELQKAVWHIREVGCYCEAFWQLCLALEDVALESKGMQTFRAFLRHYVALDSFKKMRDCAAHLLEQLSGIHLILTYENDRITISCGDVQDSYGSFLEKCFPGQRKQMKSPFEASRELTDLEQELIGAYQKQNPDFFRDAKRFYKEYREYAQETLLRFASEICYYLSFYRFEQKMKEMGFAFAEPVIIEEASDAGEGEPMSAQGLYDLALASANRGRREEIVSNDILLGLEEGFFVLTGPNQGGKTTFARSLGQLVYFAKMGLDVPAVSAKLYRFTDILTHFSVEESVETGRGKLQDELERLVPMMAGNQFFRTGAFVVINELFTTAANYDACIMGKRVLEHFLDQGCRGIYVTHLKELSQAHPRIVSLRAMLDQRGEHTFKIARSEAADNASAIHLVEKHGLTYEQLKTRLGQGL